MTKGIDGRNLPASQSRQSRAPGGWLLVLARHREIIRGAVDLSGSIPVSHPAREKLGDPRLWKHFEEQCADLSSRAVSADIGFRSQMAAHFVMILRFLRWPVSSYGCWGTRRCSDGLVGMGLQFGLACRCLLMVCVRGLQENGLVDAQKWLFWTRNRCLQVRVPKS